MLWCDLCKVHLSSQALLDIHNCGKRHRKKYAERSALTALAARSVFISGLDPTVSVTEEEISEALNCFGKVQKVHLDTKKSSFAIVEFEEEFSAQRTIYEDKVRIGSQVATVRARKVNFDQCQLKEKEHLIDTGKIMIHITKQKTFVQQVDALCDLYCLSEAQVAKRASYAQMLTEALSDYFSSNVRVTSFGSSVTSIGTKNSDIDASVFFDVPLSGMSCASDLARNKYTLLTCDLTALRGRKICAEEYARLTPADRIRLLNKIMNDIRKRSRAPITGQYPILDARCPLVRFVVNRKHIVDLSVDNYLGYAKSNWLRSIICCDVSQLIRRFLVAFRFWAYFNNLMKNDGTERSHFNAYILNLLCITYLQMRNHIPPLQRSQQEMIVEEYRIDFVVENVDLSGLQLNKLFKDFFVWFIQLKLKDIVLCPCLGRPVLLDQFKQLYADSSIQSAFKFAHLNIQDPLEWSHNVSMLVSEKRIAAMRRQMMFALSRMKINPDSFSAVLCDLRNKGSEMESSLSDYSLVMQVNVLEIDKCLEAINHVFIELLAFLPAAEPKRPRLDESFQNLSRVYMAKRRTWEGRRSVRRHIIKESPALANNSQILEKAVTHEICKASTEVSLCFKIYLKEKTEKCIVEFILLSGSAVEFKNLIHFLRSFIPAIIDDILPSIIVDEPME